MIDLPSKKDLVNLKLESSKITTKSPFPFGKYAGHRITSIPYEYLHWLCDQDFFIQQHPDWYELAQDELCGREE